MLKTGIIGIVVAALCCFTPILVILLGGIGVSWMVGYLDIVLLPALAMFVLITAFAVLRKARTWSN